MKVTRIAGAFLAFIFLTACAGPTLTKRDAFPSMYGTNKPLSMVVVPAINESTAADAGDLLNVTVAQPFANHGYYVMPVSIVSDIFRSEGVIDGTQMKGVPTKIFKDSFGADSVLFLTINQWETNYIVIAGNVTVGIEYVLLSTETNEILWSYQHSLVIDTSGSSGNVFVDILATAINTAATDYIPIAAQVHMNAVKAMPYGAYHPQTGLDGDVKSVSQEAQQGALAEE